jgi:hypothetical protein
MKFRVALLACTVATLSFAASLAAQSPNPNQPYVQSITYGGTGCPGGSMGTSINNARTEFTLIFDEFVASSGQGVPVTESRKNCQININIREPQGSGQFCTALEYRGYFNLPGGVTAEAKATYYRTTNNYELPDGQVITIGDEDGDQEGQVSHSASFVGPESQDYLRRDSDTWNYNNIEAIVRPLNVNSQVRLVGALNLSAQITTDSIDGFITPGPCQEDTTAPTISINRPVLYGLYGVGASVTPQFTCTDEHGGSGVASCTGAATLDTTAVGPKTFTVTATDNAGNTSTSSISYAVGGKEECKNGGYNQFLSPTFKNQGQCVSTYAGKK